MDQPVVSLDLARMMMGDVDGLFLAEIALRTGIVYLYTLGLLRWIGGRTVAQLSIVEFLLVIALGSAVGDSLFYPEVPLVPAMAAITAVVLINKGIDNVILRSAAAKRLVDGMPREVIRGGRVRVDQMTRDTVGIDELFARLRVEDITNLGQVEAAYLEANGAISLRRSAGSATGLRIMPPHEIAPPPRLVDLTGARDGQAACMRCGGLSPARAVLPDAPCPWCAHRHWTAPEPD